MSIAGLQVIISNFAVEQDGTEEKEIQVTRSWWERFFDPDPTRPLWQKTKPKIIHVPHYKPVMYRMMDKLIVHPSLMPAIRKAIEEQAVAHTRPGWGEYTS
jgi:hypothetical protein